MDKIDFLVNTVTQLACLLNNMVMVSDEYSKDFKDLVASEIDNIFIDLEEINQRID